jgi:Tfp pilus assembly protein PilO
MKHVVQEMGRTIRAALGSWPETVRLIVLIVVVAVIAAIWTHYHL